MCNPVVSGLIQIVLVVDCHLDVSGVGHAVADNGGLQGYHRAIVGYGIAHLEGRIRSKKEE